MIWHTSKLNCMKYCKVYRNVIWVLECSFPDVQFEQAATTELEWLTDAERRLSCVGDVRLQPEQTTAQLQAQKVSPVLMWSSLTCVVTESQNTQYVIKRTLPKAHFLLQSFSMDIMRHKDAVDDIVKTGEAMNNKDEAEKQALRVNKWKCINKLSLICVQ